MDWDGADDGGKYCAIGRNDIKDIHNNNSTDTESKRVVNYSDDLIKVQQGGTMKRWISEKKLILVREFSAKAI